jgi:hypothetical protein
MERYEPEDRERATMTKIELNGFRAALKNRQAELENGNRSRGALAIETNADELDRIQHGQEREMAIGTLDRNSKLMREVRAALRRYQLVIPGKERLCTMSSERYSLNATTHALILTDGQYESLEVPAGSIVTLTATTLDRRFYEAVWGHHNLMVFTDDWKTNAEIIHPAITAAQQECRQGQTDEHIDWPGTDSPDGQGALQLERLPQAIERRNRPISEVIEFSRLPGRR